ncbi:efflux RND transporter periplasmic adaptor subunit [Sulfidibacter corallicola]|uniref:Efflux RND transporter periplasmic adaptor subunit n=2 Tax=Sulfidibacter corallicola TaxID=2818388 RepID=A0A8A4TTY3_SULCO|nr:efflux RND transporter periplasmic adaptor subunit [Sulfidibacter corallicola]
MILMVVGALQIGCSQATQGGQQPAANGQTAKKKEVKPIPVAVTTVEVDDAASYYTTTTTIQAEYRASILARTTGVVRHLAHEEGATVEAGEMLLQLEDDDQKLKVRQAQLELKHLQNEQARRAKMREAGFLSPQEYDEIENQVERAMASVEEAELALSYTQVRAPFSGRLVRRLIDLGANVQPGTELFQIMDVDPLLLRVYIPANRLGRVQPGQEIKIRRDSDGTELTGIINLVSPIVDAESGTVKVTAQITSYPEGIRPGDFVEARVVTELRRDAMLVPSVAVFEEKGESILYVSNSGKAERRVVEVGFVESGKTEILEGITANDMVVVKGQRNLRDGIPIDVKEGGAGARAAGADSGFTGASL